MNLDLLKKLTRLANSNPNDNEANLAARRVCKMLEEGNWTLNESNPVTWNDVKRTTEPQFKSKPPTTQVENDVWNFYPGGDNPFTSSKQEYQKTQQEYQNQANNFYREYLKNLFNRNPEVYKNVMNEPTKTEKPKKEKRTLICIDCKKSVETSYVGHPDTFSCFTCVWERYTTAKGK